MNPVDLLLLTILATTTVLGMQRGLLGFAVGVVALLLFRPLLLLAYWSAPLAIGLATIAGLGVGLGLRMLGPRLNPGEGFKHGLGGLGGGILGVLLLLTLVTSLPIERDLNNRIVYPPRSLPLPVAEAVLSSRLVDVGRDILLYPLLNEGGLGGGILAGLHGFFVVGEPWEGG